MDCALFQRVELKSRQDLSLENYKQNIDFRWAHLKHNAELMLDAVDASGQIWVDALEEALSYERDLIAWEL
jgi:hypothetical protein